MVEGIPINNIGVAAPGQVPCHALRHIQVAPECPGEGALCTLQLGAFQGMHRQGVAAHQAQQIPLCVPNLPSEC